MRAHTPDQPPPHTTTAPKVALIVNSDDLGYAWVRDQGILALWAEGCISSASALVNGASASLAIPAAVAAGLPTGLHLNLTEGVPVSPPGSVPTLLDGRGAFLGKQEFRDAVAAGEVSVQCVATEAAAQLAAFLTLSGGVPPTHVDGHQHIQTLPLIAGVIVAQFAALRCVRLPTLHPAEEGGVARMPPQRAQFYHTVSSEAGGVAPVFAAAGLRSPAFLGYTCMGDDATVAGVANMLAEASAGGEGEGPQF